MPMMHLNAFSQCCPISQNIGQWKNPNDKMSDGYLDVEVWVELAKTLERGCFDAFFLADIHGLYDGYGGTWNAAVQYAVQAPGLDPMPLIPAMAMATKHLGFSVTYSTTFHAPYECARVFTSLDHYTKGRIGWNIVTSYVKNTQANGLGIMLPHDQRYDRAEEYMDVVYKLWEQSWDGDAVVRDIERDMYVDPAKVRSIDHEGEHFSVVGPLMCEPAAQRTPVLYQAGASPRGLDFGAKHAEAIFMGGRGAELRQYVDSFRERVASFGRDPHGVKLMMSITPVVGETEAEARRKHEDTMQYASFEGQLTLYGGWTGIDLKGVNPDTPLGEVDSDGMRAAARRMRGKTIRELLAQRIDHRLIGDPSYIADRMEAAMESGVDGFIIQPVIQPQSHIEFVDMVVPELQRRGVLRREYEEGETLRERYFGKGHKLTRPDHPSAQFRGQGSPMAGAAAQSNGS